MSVREEKLGNLCLQIRGIAYGKDEIHELPLENTIPLLRATNILESGEIDAADVLHVNTGCVNPKQILKKGDVLISASTGSKSSIGKPARVRGDDGVTFGAFCKALRPNTKLIDPDYFWFVFCRPEYRSYISNVVGGANINNIRNEHIDEFVIPLPPLATQKHIARVLEQADQLRKQAQQMESELNQLAQSLFLEMFGDPVKNPKGWDRKPLSDVAKLARGRFSARPRNDPQFYGGQYPFIQTGSVVASDTYITTHEQTLNDKGLAVSKIFPSGTIAITIAANIGATAILTYPTCFPDSVVGITAGAELGVEFLEYQLRFFKQQLDSDATETAQKNINLQVLEPLMMIVPPRKEQEEFVGAYNLIHEQLTLIRTTKLAAVNGFNSLMQRAFNGELTVPERKAA